MSFTKIDLNSCSRMPQNLRQTNGRPDFEWQLFSELDVGTAMTEAREILEGAGILDANGVFVPEQLIKIRDTVKKEEWQRIKGRLQSLDPEINGRCVVEGYLVGVWADLFSEPYSRNWLAGMMYYSYFLLEQDYPIGWFMTLMSRTDRSGNN